MGEEIEKDIKKVTVPEGDMKIIDEEKQDLIDEIEEDLVMINEAKKKKGIKVKKALGKKKEKKEKKEENKE